MTTNTQFRKVSAALLATFTLLSAGTSLALAATATWTPQTVLSADFAFAEMDSNPAVAVNLNGRAVAVWDKPLPSTGGFGFGGPTEVTAAVRATATGAWSTPVRLTPAGGNGRHAGAVVDSATGKVTVALNAGGIPSVSTSSDGGLTWVGAPVPIAAGFAYLNGSRLIDIDSKGNVTLILFKPRATADGYDVAAVTRSSTGTWRAPVVLNGSAGVNILASPTLEVIADGRALLSLGTTTFRRSSTGAWSPAKTVNITGFDLLDRTYADMDANGRGYMVLRLIKANVGAIYLSTSSQTGDWSLPRLMTGLETYYGGLQVTASSSGRAMISATDSASHVRATVTTDSGTTWSAPADFGAGLTPFADGSESGLYALSWFGTGNAAMTAAGSGSGTAPWVTATIGNYVVNGTPVVAIAGKSGSSTARTASAWERSGDPATPAGGVAAATASVAR